VKLYLSEIFPNSEIKENTESSMPNNIKMDIEKINDLFIKYKLKMPIN
tara:strand:+ start:56 stop:199 length:144 start_codon:yes stop_codon:yes gene_type:complete